MADPKHPRRFSGEFKWQIVGLVNAGKPKADVMREYDLGKSTLDRWVRAINATGSPRAEGLLLSNSRSMDAHSDLVSLK